MWGSMTGRWLRWIGSVLLIVCANRMYAAVSRNVCLLAPLICMLDLFLVKWYVLVAVYLSWKGLTSLLTTAMFAFTCRYGTFECVVMPYGLKNTPSHF